MKKRGFDIRREDYNYIHSNTDEDWAALVDAVNPQAEERIFDGAGGYGEVTKKLLERVKNLEIFVIDSSNEQLQRLRDIELLDAEHTLLGDIRNIEIEDNFFDRAVIKMGIHEVPKQDQVKVLKEVFRVLKKGGKFVMWELALDQYNQDIFQDVIREKDSLSGFGLLAEKRYFPTNDENFQNFWESGFANAEVFYTKKYQVKPILRVHELASLERSKGKYDEEELNDLGMKRVKELSDYIRNRVPDYLKSKLHFKDSGGHEVQFEVEKIIYVAYKE